MSDPPLEVITPPERSRLDGPLGKAFGRSVPHARLDTPRNPPGRSLDRHSSLSINDLEGTSPLFTPEYEVCGLVVDPGRTLCSR